MREYDRCGTAHRLAVYSTIRLTPQGGICPHHYSVESTVHERHY